MSAAQDSAGPDPSAVHARLLARAQTVATAESLTGGLIAAALTQVPGSSSTMRGGLVVYATDLKVSLAGVDAELIERLGPVDAQVALALADGARTVCGATWGIGVTGVAGPQAQGGRPVGEVHLAVTGAGSSYRQSVVVPGDRDQVRTAAVHAALALLERALESDQ